MKNKKQNSEFDFDVNAFMGIISNPRALAGLLGLSQELEEKYPYERLGSGFELRPIEMKDEDGKEIFNDSQYSHLYWKDKKVCDSVFRKGGMGGEYKDGYCDLIHYTQKEPHTQKRHGFDFGVHVIINQLGEICLSGSGISSYPSHYGGHVGKLKDTYYDLRTGEKLLTCSSAGSINGKELIFVEHRYDWYNENMPLGVYTISKTSCLVTKIDDIK